MRINCYKKKKKERVWRVKLECNLREKKINLNRKRNKSYKVENLIEKLLEIGKNFWREILKIVYKEKMKF